jgi:hypothetical protein
MQRQLQLQLQMRGSLHCALRASVEMTDLLGCMSGRLQLQLQLQLQRQPQLQLR